MRILHVISTIAPRYGGPSAAVRGMAESLAARGANVTIATTDADGPGRLPIPPENPATVGGVEYRYFRRGWTRNWHFSMPMTRWLRRSVSHFDVVEVHGLFSYATIAGCRSAARAGVPYVLRPLGTLAEWSLARRGWKKRPYYRLVEKRHLERASAIHVTSEAEAGEIARLGFGSKVHVIPLGVYVDAEPPPRSRPADGMLRLLFLSRVHPKKGLELLLAALSSLAPEARRGISLTIAGGGEPAYLRMLESEVARRRLDDVVRFVGELQGEEKAAALGEADVFVLPSYNENFGIAAAEAFAAGLPSILSSEVALGGPASERGAALVVPLDAEAIAHAIERLAADAEERRAMGRNAWRFAATSLSWESCALRLLELYAAVARDCRA